MTPVIIDTDFSSDVGDLGGLATACAFHRLGRWQIVGVICNTSASKAPGAIAATLAWWGVTGALIGCWKGGALDPGGPGAWMESIYDNYPHTGVGLASTVGDATNIYRQLLAARSRPDLVIVSIGLMSNLSALLDSSADAYSALDGRSLVAASVRRLVVMGGNFPSGVAEWNLQNYPTGANNVASHWPSEVFWNGENIGHSIISGAPLASKPSSDLMRTGYSVAGYSGGRAAWDEMAVFAAAQEFGGFILTRGRAAVDISTGIVAWVTSTYGPHFYTTKLLSDAAFKARIDQLICADVSANPLFSDWTDNALVALKF